MILYKLIFLESRCFITYYIKAKHVFYVQNLFYEKLAFLEIMWKNVLYPDWSQTTV